jgi:phosphatidylserine decarboxylase
MLSREGRVPVMASIAVALVATLGLGVKLGWSLWLMVIGMVYVFRDPKRTVPALPLAIVSPVDGRVRALRPTEDPWLKRDAMRIGISLPFLGIGPLRSPTEGKVMEYKLAVEVYRRASFCVVPRGTAVCHALWVRTDEGDDVVFVVSSHWRVNRLRRYVSVGERVGQGQRCGFVYFASRVDILVPAGCRTAVSPGQKVRAGADVVASLVHP